MMKNKKPEVRFKGFSEEWEEKELGKVVDLLTGYPFGSKSFTESGIPLVRGMNVKRGYLDMSKNICEYWHTAYGLENYLLKENDIVIQMDGALIGKSYAKIHKKNLPALLVQRVTRVRSDKVNSEFIYQSIQRNFLDYILSIKTETAVPHLSLNDIRDYQITTPSNEEQTQIGNFFKNLDNLISLHQRKYEKLGILKKAMLEKMFPKNGADVPEIRFKGFSEAWEEKKYSEIFTNISNNTLSRADLNFESGLAKNIHYGDILIKFGELLNVEKAKMPYISDSVLANKLSNSKLQDGDIIIADAAEDETVGKCTEVVNVGKEIVLAGLHTIPVRPKFNFASGYLGYFMNSNSFHNQLLRLMQGTKVLSISKSAIQDTLIFFANDVEEQEKIGNYFKNLDNLLTLHQRELDKLKNLKKALLEKMFV